MAELEERYKVEDVSTGARFGRPAVIDIIGNKSRTARIQGAKDQIAGICQEIIADPENSVRFLFWTPFMYLSFSIIQLGLLRRLHTFSLTSLSTPSHPDPVPNDIVIRKLSILSQLAVFKDIIPGYRIRALTDKEKSEKVSQMVARTRDWEQGLVFIYQSYLRSLETELKGNRRDLVLRQFSNYRNYYQKKLSWRTLHCNVCALWPKKSPISIFVSTSSHALLLV